MSRLIIPGHAGIDIQCEHVVTDRHGHVWFFDGSYEQWACVDEQDWDDVRVKARIVHGILILEDTPCAVV
jgi:hypothetical protein